MSYHNKEKCFYNVNIKLLLAVKLIILKLRATENSNTTTIAKKTGLSHTTLTAICTDKHIESGLKFETLLNVLDKLGVNYSLLLSNNEPESFTLTFKQDGFVVKTLSEKELNDLTPLLVAHSI